MTEAAFYCVADERYFLGAVGLVNSLRLVGHRETITLLDCGLTEAQRELVKDEVELHTVPPETPPWLLKSIAPLARPATVRILIDTDMIATRSLDPLIERVAGGGVAAFRDRQQRYFPEWGELLDLGPVREIPYVSSGLVAFGGETGERVLRLFHDRQPKIDFERTFWRRNERDYPFLYADQDVLNAVLSSHREGVPFTALDERLAATPPFRGLRIFDEARLRCRYPDGAEPFVLHQYLRKPWLESTYDGVYSRLLRRLLGGDDLAVTPPPEWVPAHLRPGTGARLRRVAINAGDYLRWHLGDRLPAPVAMRVEDRRRRREARR